jgi:membrane fusion protein, multidrug efflux system
MQAGVRLLPLCLLLATVVGCQRSTAQVALAEPTVLPVSKPVSRQVTDFVAFTGRTEAVDAVDIRPRVTGYLQRTYFQEGSIVKKDDLLFLIDPRPYQAQLEQAESQVKLNQASLKLANVTYQRDKAIVATSAGAISQQQLDQDLAAVEEAQARLQATQATTEVYKLNLKFTKVYSPVDGMISRFYLTPGNLVLQDQTLLTTVVSLDPMYVYFDMDEPTLLQIRRAVNEGKIKRVSSRSEIPLFMGLQGETGYPHQGALNFVNNQVNPATGSITVRGLFSNPQPSNGVRLLSPGMFVRVELPIGFPHEALLVIDRAIGFDQGNKFVYVVDAANKIQYRRISTGPLQPDGLRVITEGLKAGDWVLVGGVQQVRPNMAIQPEQHPMPSLGAAAGEPPSAPAGQPAPGLQQRVPAQPSPPANPPSPQTTPLAKPPLPSATKGRSTRGNSGR